MKAFYDFGYRYIRMPWDVGPRAELVELVENGRLEPCKAIDLGSGTASNCVFLAQHGFTVTGVDYSHSAIELGRSRAAEAGVSVEFIQDDLTDLRHVSGTFDLLVDYGVLDDLVPAQRDLYMKNIVPISHPGSRFLLYCFEWQPRWWERLYFYRMACDPGEIERRFGPHFEIERFASGKFDSRFVLGWAAYLMIRKG